MAASLTLARYADEQALQDALAFVACGDAPALAGGTACAWYLRQQAPARALALVDALLENPGLASELERPAQQECRAYLWLVRAETSALSGQFGRAREALAMARATLGAGIESRCASDALWIEAELANDEGDFEARDRLMAEAAQMADALQDAERRDLARLALACFDAMRHGDVAHSRWSDQAQRLRAARAPALRVYANFYLVLLSLERGDYACALELATYSRQAAESCGLIRRAILDGANVASILQELGDYDASMAYVHPVVEQARRLGWPSALGYALTMHAQALCGMGRYAAAAQLAQEAVETLRALERSNSYHAAMLALAEASFGAGDLTGAERAYRVAASTSYPSSKPFDRYYGVLGLAKVAARTGSPAEAHALCLEVLTRRSAASDYALHIEALQLLARLLQLEPALGGLAGLSDPAALLRHAIGLAQQFLDGAGTHGLYTALSEHLEQQQQPGPALEALRAALAALQAEKSRAATRQSLALEVQFKTERALAEANLHRLAAQAESARAEELSSLNTQLNAALASLQQAQQALLQRNEELHAAYEQINELSLTDPLTGLRNRRFLAQAMDAAAAECLRSHFPGAAAEPAGGARDIVFFLLDVDHFKLINDRHGHAGGDAVLVQMRDRLRAATREQDFLVRWGGEEFLIAARGLCRQEAPLMAERLRQSICSAPFLLDEGVQHHGTVSIGFAAFPLDPAAPTAQPWEKAVELADTRLYQAKRAGRDCCIGA